LIFIAVLLGFASRSGSSLLPAFIKEYAGDTLWALAVYLAAAFLFPRFSTAKIAAISAIFSLAVEISQLYHAPWIDAVRSYRTAALILGHGFLWSDLACYAAGISLGVLLERFGPGFFRSIRESRSGL
jgi:hypothetical protein